MNVTVRGAAPVCLSEIKAAIGAIVAIVDGWITFGESPVVPKWNVLLTTPVLVVSRYQFPFDGRKTPTLVIPSPFQSPITGISPVVPKWNDAATTPVFVVSIYQLPVAVRKTPTALTDPIKQSSNTVTPRNVTEKVFFNCFHSRSQKIH
jgi:hypothetical protein